MEQYTSSYFGSSGNKRRFDDRGESTGGNSMIYTIQVLKDKLGRILSEEKMG